ncbi:DNA repair protein SWI5 homolog [Xenopus laevis]|uniref:DNA repair protein SWI5 homolog n=1 Tax=Xenopus laevis TaxID=8355 RepID=A0A8J1LI20_XENLA|nr:DNA repair protein SWI5 homolog [Xenopus laevis]
MSEANGNSGEQSPGAGGTLREEPGADRHISPFITPRPRSSLRRTPLGMRRNCNSGFKSPVQSPCSSQSSRGSEFSLQKEVSELKGKVAALDQEISQLESEGVSVAELEEHITLLHEYNELKDAGQMLLGRLAVLRGVTTKELYAEFGMNLED